MYAKNESIFYFPTIYKANRNYARKKHPSSGYPAAKHPKHSKFVITDIREKPVNFFLLFNTGVDFGLRNNFAKSSSFAKVSIPVHNYNSLVYVEYELLYSLLVALVMTEGQQSKVYFNTHIKSCL